MSRTMLALASAALLLTSSCYRDKPANGSAPATDTPATAAPAVPPPTTTTAATPTRGAAANA